MASDHIRIRTDILKQVLRLLQSLGIERSYIMLTNTDINPGQIIHKIDNKNNNIIHIHLKLEVLQREGRRTSPFIRFEISELLSTLEELEAEMARAGATGESYTELHAEDPEDVMLTVRLRIGKEERRKSVFKPLVTDLDYYEPAISQYLTNWSYASDKARIVGELFIPLPAQSLTDAEHSYIIFNAYKNQLFSTLIKADDYSISIRRELVISDVLPEAGSVSKEFTSGPYDIDALLQHYKLIKDAIGTTDAGHSHSHSSSSNSSSNNIQFSVSEKFLMFSVIRQGRRRGVKEEYAEETEYIIDWYQAPVNKDVMRKVYSILRRRKKILFEGRDILPPLPSIDITMSAEIFKLLFIVARQILVEKEYSKEAIIPLGIERDRLILRSMTTDHVALLDIICPSTIFQSYSYNQPPPPSSSTTEPQARLGHTILNRILEILTAEFNEEKESEPHIILKMTDDGGPLLGISGGPIQPVIEAFKKEHGQSVRFIVDIPRGLAEMIVISRGKEQRFELELVYDSVPWAPLPKLTFNAEIKNIDASDFMKVLNIVSASAPSIGIITEAEPALTFIASSYTLFTDVLVRLGGERKMERYSTSGRQIAIYSIEYLTKLKDIIRMAESVDIAYSTKTPILLTFNIPPVSGVQPQQQEKRLYVAYYLAPRIEDEYAIERRLEAYRTESMHTLFRCIVNAENLLEVLKQLAKAKDKIRDIWLAVLNDELLFLLDVYTAITFMRVKVKIEQASSVIQPNKMLAINIDTTIITELLDVLDSVKAIGKTTKKKGEEETPIAFSINYSHDYNDLVLKFGAAGEGNNEYIEATTILRRDTTSILSREGFMRRLKNMSPALGEPYIIDERELKSSIPKPSIAEPEPLSVTLSADRTSINTGDIVNFTISWTGGRAPYSVRLLWWKSVRWSADNIFQTTVSISHPFRTTGEEQFTAEVIDRDDRKATSNPVTITVSAPPQEPPSTPPSPPPTPPTPPSTPPSVPTVEAERRRREEEEEEEEEEERERRRGREEATKPEPTPKPEPSPVVRAERKEEREREREREREERETREMKIEEEEEEEREKVEAEVEEEREKKEEKVEEREEREEKEKEEKEKEKEKEKEELPTNIETIRLFENITGTQATREDILELNILLDNARKNRWSREQTLRRIEAFAQSRKEEMEIEARRERTAGAGAGAGEGEGARARRVEEQEGGGARARGGEEVDFSLKPTEAARVRLPANIRLQALKNRFRALRGTTELREFWESLTEEERRELIDALRRDVEAARRNRNSIIVRSTRETMEALDDLADVGVSTLYYMIVRATDDLPVTEGVINIKYAKVRIPYLLDLWTPAYAIIVPA